MQPIRLPEEGEKMKEMTRKYYQKSLALGAAILVGAVLVTGSYVSAGAGAAATFIPAGDDRFETTDNGETQGGAAAGSGRRGHDHPA
jgi:hypothetical protein